MHVLVELLVLFAFAVPAVLLAHRLRLPAIAAFLAVGILVGPAGLGVIASRTDIDVLAELGVIVLLFGIGVELNLKRVRRMLREMLVVGGLEVVLPILDGNVG